MTTPLSTHLDPLPVRALDTVLFDLDGTLNDSQLGIITSLRHALATIGLDDPGHEALMPAIGPPFEVMLPQLGFPAERLDDIIAAYRERYDVTGMFENELYPGVVELLDAVAALGVRLAIATAKPEPTALGILEHFGLTDRFATIAGATHVRTGPGSRRTKGEVIAEALMRLGIPAGEAPARAVMIGDRDHDVEGASEHGIPVIGVEWGYGSRNELLGAGASVVCATPSEVAACLAATYRSGTA